MTISEADALKMFNAPEGATAPSTGELSKSQAMALFGEKPPPSAPERPQGLVNQLKDNYQDFGSNVMDAMVQRRKLASEIVDRYAKDEQGLLSTVTQMTGKVGLGASYDFLAETLMLGGKNLVSMLPDQIEDPVRRGVAEAGIAFLETDMGQAGIDALVTGAETYGEWKEQNPVHAANLESVVNIGLFLAPAAKQPSKLLPRRGGLVERKLDDWAGWSINKVKAKSADKLVRPMMTKNEYARDIAFKGRSQELGLMSARQRVDRLAGTQKEQVAELVKLDIKPRRSLQYNLEVVSKEVDKSVNNLAKRLNKVKRVASDAEIENMHAVARTHVRRTPVLRGDAEKILRENMEPFVRAQLARHGNTPAGMLKTRKALDNWVSDFTAGRVYADDTASALKTALDGYRKALNGTTDTLAPGFNVRQALKKQTTLLDAQWTIATKVADEARNVYSRLWAKTLNLVKARTELVGLTAAMLGVTYMQASGQVAPFMLSGAGLALGLGGYRAVVSPKTRQGIAGLIRLSKSTTRAADETRMDRLYLQQFLDEAVDQNE